MSNSDYGRIDLTNIQIDRNRERMERVEARQVASQESFVEACEEAFNPWAADKDKREKFRTLEERAAGARTSQAAQARLATSDKAGDTAKSFQANNPELSSDALTALARSLNSGDPAGVVLRQVMQFFPDPYLAAEAMEYLAAIATGELLEAVKQAREEHNRTRKRQVVAGRNISEQARQFAEKGLGTPSALRELYEDVTHNPRDPLPLFEEFAAKYPFERLATVLQFMFHSLGSDLNSKGPSIESGELYQLLNEVRTLQAILGVYRFFKGRMNLLQRQFKREQWNYPDALTFEILSKQFVKLAMERYPNSAKVLHVAEQLKLKDGVQAQILILMQLRDAIRGLSPKIYRTEKHRQDLLDAIIDALSELEDLAEEEEGEEEK